MYHELIISYIAALGKGAETAWNNIQTLGEADEKLSQSMGS
ncbi:YwqI/YxiC family protein [Alkalihalobacillus clausii]|nr:YwqI/YxiC family protein [Shouchella clausii]